jgi:hypothetical protein
MIKLMNVRSFSAFFLRRCSLKSFAPGSSMWLLFLLFVSFFSCLN